MIFVQMITLGVDAELELEDLDPFSEGVVFSVRPPKKSWKNIVNLSGGEKVCCSQFFIFIFILYLCYHIDILKWNDDCSFVDSQLVSSCFCTPPLQTNTTLRYG